MHHLVRSLSLMAGLLPACAVAGEATADPYKDSGINPLSAVKLTVEQEAAILKDVTVAEGMDLTLFAPSQMINYPIFIAAAPDGTVFVGSDGNGAQGRAPNRGRIVRLRDTDGDGRADETKLFVKNVDSPRGVVWDRDRLYVVHPPHLSAFIDQDGDGEAEKQEILVDGIGWDFKGRAADHATNGVELGVDGYLYIAGGDFGIIKATGKDGTVIQHRAGGVIRVRTDGTGLEVFATGTRNILEVATSPLLDHFTRDNTNDGGGWDVRFHYFTGLENHGYPWLYKNFADEHIKPLSDYGGGSGCGAVWIDEPAFKDWAGEWAGAPFTVDWGTGAVARHRVKRVGASYEEVEKPRQIVKLSKPCDADIDAMGNLYVTSWKGAVFNWAGTPDVGYVARVRPKGYIAPPLLDVAKADAAALVTQLEDASHRRRQDAQRELIRRAQAGTALPKTVQALADDAKKPLAVRVVALAALHQSSTIPLAMPRRAVGDPLVEYDLRFAADRAQPITVAAIDAKDPRIVLQAVIAAARAKQLREVIPLAAPLAAQDERIAHTLYRALGHQADEKLCLDLIDRSDTAPVVRTAALRGLAMLHTKAAVDGLIERLGKEGDPARRRGLLGALCRLHFIEGEWKGDSWGTRPDTRGPYYQPDPWAETPTVIAALKAILAKAAPDEAAFLVAEMTRNRIKSDEALVRILGLAKQDPAHIPALAQQLVTADDIPSEAVPLLIQAAQLKDAVPGTYVGAVVALSKVNSADGVKAQFQALESLEKIKGTDRERNMARTALTGSKLLANHVAVLAELADKGPGQGIAESALLALAVDKNAAVEVKAQAMKAIDDACADQKRLVRILNTIAKDKLGAHGEHVKANLDSPDKEVAKAAKNAAEKLGLNQQVADTTPKVNTLKREEVLAQVMTVKGDKNLGEQLFARQSCVACHTTSQDQPPKGPYLGNIAQTYKRAELAEAIIDPGKSVSQGFVTNLIGTKDGAQHMGFVTFESPEKITIRNLAAQETTIAAGDITSRTKLPTSMMPPGLVDQLTIREFSSLLDYLEALAKK
jgi:putative heme-binding domain-containing protein